MSFFGKNPNGLSINTGGGAAAGGSSLFGGTSSSQPQQQGSGLFGSSTTTSQPAQAGSLFGSTTNTSQPQQGAGLFGPSTAGSQPQPGGLFGSATPQPQQSGGLFGSNAASQPKQGGGLFGSSTTSQPQQSNAPSGSALFGASSTQPQAGGGLFGSQPNQNQSQGGGLFSSLGQKQQSQPQQPSTGLFGSLGQSQQSQPQQNTSLFGGSTFGQPQSQPQQSTSLFGNSFVGQSQPQQQQPPQPQSSAFGTLGAQGRAATASLFGSSTAQRPSQSLFPGPLTMGQSTNTAQPTSTQPGPSAPTTVPGVTIDLTQIRGTTRFNDLHTDVQSTIEKIDTFIAQQISHAEQCAQLLPSHADSLSYIAPDVGFVAARLETAEAGIDNDTRAIRDLREVVERDGEDAKRAFRALENLKLPERFHYPGMWASAQHHYHARPAQTGVGGSGGADPAEEVAAATDLVGYFEGVVREMEALLERYTGNMREIEEHLRTVEQGAIRQTKELMARKGREKAGGEEGVSRKEENLRELATVLREFENGILHVAGSVGACREQVQEFMLGGTNGLGRNGFGGSIGGNGWGRLGGFARA